MLKTFSIADVSSLEDRGKIRGVGGAEMFFSGDELAFLFDGSRFMPLLRGVAMAREMALVSTGKMVKVAKTV